MDSVTNDGENWKVGTFVWGKMNRRHWPGIIVSHTHLNCKPPKGNMSLVFWFGDYRVSKISNSQIVDFIQNFLNLFVNARGRIPKTWRASVIEAVREVGMPHTEELNESQLIKWAKLRLHEGCIKTIGLTTFVQEKLKILCVKSDKPDEDTAECKKNANANDKELISKFKQGLTTSLDICLGCYSSNIIDEHPIFEGSVCHRCIIKLKSSYFVIGYDGIKYFCTICACQGDVIVCERKGCSFVYCYECVDVFAKTDARAEILNKSVWHCFVCDNDSDLKGILSLRSSWKYNIAELFRTGNNLAIPKLPVQKRPIRVLSLFDGIGSGLTALEKLNIEIDAYYSSEIDEDSINIVKKNYPSGVVFLGDIKKLSDDDVISILPIDLLLGGSPCNDLSLVNPKRKGLFDADGSGILFFEYYRILTTMQMHNGRPFFWLFENVDSMSHGCRQSISRYLQCEPTLIDAAWVSSMRRPRLFWGNLHSLQGQRFVDDGPDLQSDLMAERTATVDKLQTVTTRSNSLLQGPKMKMPVLCRDGREDHLRITELENVFGFPINYTQLNNLSDNKRQSLLGKAWSVKVVSVLLNCLRDYFKLH